jgi:hypothetical protein
MEPSCHFAPTRPDPTIEPANHTSRCLHAPDLPHAHAPTNQNHSDLDQTHITSVDDNVAVSIRGSAAQTPRGGCWYAQRRAIQKDSMARKIERHYLAK